MGFSFEIWFVMLRNALEPTLRRLDSLESEQQYQHWLLENDSLALQPPSVMSANVN